MNDEHNYSEHSSLITHRSSLIVRIELLPDQRIERRQDFGCAGVFAHRVFAGPLVRAGEGVAFDGDVAQVGDDLLRGWR